MLFSALPIHWRRQARRLAYANGAIWALGNGLVSSMLVVYLAMQYNVSGMGLGISLILAAPQIAGLLRMLVPAMIATAGHRKAFCLISYVLSGLVLTLLPFVAAPGRLPSPVHSLIVLVACWCVYHLLEYFGTVALWSWLADLVPLRIRGRFLGRRERWMVACQAVAMIAAGLFSYGWKQFGNPGTSWVAYAVPAVAGAILLIAAVVPLALMPHAARGTSPTGGRSLPSLLRPLRDGRFVRLVVFGCWLSLFNGLTQSPQNMYPYFVLGIDLFFMLVLKTTMRVGQLAVSPWVGRQADRWGNRPVMLAAVPIIALGMFCFLLSGPGQPPWLARFWIAAGWLMWIAWVGVNVGLPNLMLKLAPQQANLSYIAAYYAITGVFHAGSTILGGVAFDSLRYERFVFFGGMLDLDFYHYAFLFGWITRTLSLLLLWRVWEEAARPSPGSK